jgi:excisionase family DNA binding protein
MEFMGKLYTVEDIAKITGLTSRTIRNYLRNGSLDGKKLVGNGVLLWRT